jgi:hypothetical protein
LPAATPSPSAVCRPRNVVIEAGLDFAIAPVATRFSISLLGFATALDRVEGLVR